MSGIFGGGNDVHTYAPKISGMQFQTSTRGKPLPVVFGTNRLAINVIDYVDFTAIPHTETQSGGKGGGSSYSNTTYTYTACVLLGVCHGPVTAFTRVWADKDVHSTGSLGLTEFLGSADQQPFGYMVSAHPDRALAYRRLAYLAAAAYDLGSSATMPNHSVEVRAPTALGTSIPTGTSGGWQAALTGLLYSFINSTVSGNGFVGFYNGIPDAEPSVIITQLLTNPEYGAGFPAGKLADPANFRSYCLASGLFLSPIYAEQSSARDAINNILDAVGAAAVHSAGQLRFVPFGTSAETGHGSTWTPDLSPLYDLTDDDFLEAPRIRRNSSADAYNRHTIKYTDRRNDYNEAVAEASDDADIEIFGLRPAPEFVANGVCDEQIANRVAHIRLERAREARNVYEFVLGWRHCLLEPMDIVTLTDAALRLDRQPVRIMEIDEDEYGYLQVTAWELQLESVVSPRYGVQASDALVVNYNAPADATAQPEIIELESSAYRIGEEMSLGIAARGSGDNWGGCEVWISFDGTSYIRAGDITNPARYGTLSASISSGSPGAVGSIQLSGGALISSTPQNAGQLSTLSLIGNEMCSYSTATLTGQNAYDLTLAVRGAYGTAESPHLVGERFVRLDEAVFWLPMGFDKVGTLLYIKLPAYNIYGGGKQSVSEVEPIEYLISGLNVPPPDVQELLIDDNIKLRWKAVSVHDLAGYELRYNLGTVPDWDAASTLHSGLLSECQFVSARPFSGQICLLVKAMDYAGNYSTNPAMLILGAGDVILSNVFETIDLSAWDGVLTGGAIVDGCIAADDVPGLWSGNAGDSLWSGDAAASIWVGEWGEMTYTTPPITISAAAEGYDLVALYTHNASRFQLYYRFQSTDWQPYTNAIRAEQGVQFRIVFPPSTEAPRLCEFRAVIDVPDKTERLLDIPIAAAGTRLPITKTYFAILQVGDIAIQDDGGAAVGCRVIDKDPSLGPLVRLYNSDGNPTTGVLDVTIQGY